MIERLTSWANDRGYRVSWGPERVIEAVRTNLESRIDAGELDSSLVQDQLSSFCFDTPRPPGGSWIVLLVAMPRPAHRVTFVVSGRMVETLIPPTYVRYRATYRDIRQDLVTNALVGARVEWLDIPLKPLAARLGLARYGRNNVTYIDGLGSYFQLAAYITDAPLTVDASWQPREPQLLDECDDCGICEAVCPTGAIRDDRVLLHAEHCLTFANENPATLPPWVPAGAHNSLIGCLNCQQHCPANPLLPIEDTGIIFSEEETAVLLAEGMEPLARTDAIRQKLAPLGLTEEKVIGRNLRALAGVR